MGVDLGELYAGPWQDFVARRGRLVAAARAAGDRAGAKALQELKKPTRGAWLVNLIARHEADQLAEVLELGDALARAHRDADPGELRRLSALRTAVVNSLAGRASALGAERGYAAPDSVRQEVAETLQAALADPELAERVLAGTMVATVRAAGFGPADLFAAPPTLAPVIPLRRGKAPAAPAEEAGPDPAEVRRLSRDLGRAESRLEEAQERLARVGQAAAEAAEEHARQDDRVADLGEQVARARAHLEALQEQERAARDRLSDLATDMAERAAARDRAITETADLEAAVEALTARLTELGIDY